MNEKLETPSFLERWSRRKRGLDDGLPEPLAEEANGGATPQVGPAEPGDAGGGTDGETAETPKDFSDFDFEKLDYESDYTQFMDKNVSSNDRHKALRKLWVSNPVLANMDGLDDYCEDYTDAAVCLPKGMMKTAYQYGRGFLNDDEVAEWEALGAESKTVEPSEGEPEPAETVVVAEASEASEAAPLDRAAGPGAGCAVSVKQADEEMLAEFEAEHSEKVSKA
jgi:hypothetical protein